MRNLKDVTKDVFTDLSNLEHVTVTEKKIFIDTLWFLDRSDIETYLKRRYELIDLNEDESEGKIQDLIKEVLDHFKKNISHYKELLKLDFYYHDLNSESEDYFVKTLDLNNRYWLRPSSSFKGCIVLSWRYQQSTTLMQIAGTPFMFNENLPEKCPILLKDFSTYKTIKTANNIPVVKLLQPINNSIKNKYEEDGKVLEQIRQFLNQHFKPHESTELDWVIANKQIVLIRKISPLSSWLHNTTRKTRHDLIFTNNKLEIVKKEIIEDRLIKNVVLVENKDAKVTLKLEIGLFGYKLINQKYLEELQEVQNKIVHNEATSVMTLISSLEDLAQITNTNNLKIIPENSESKDYLVLRISGQCGNWKFYEYMYQMKHAYLLTAQLNCLYNELTTIQHNTNLSTDLEKYKRVAELFKNFITYLRSLNNTSYLNCIKKIRTENNETMEDLYLKANSINESNVSKNNFRDYIKKVHELLVGEYTAIENDIEVDYSWDYVWFNVLKNDEQLSTEFRNSFEIDQTISLGYIHSSKIATKNSAKRFNPINSIDLYIPKSNNLINRFRIHVEEAVKSLSPVKKVDTKNQVSTVTLNRVIRFLNILIPDILTLDNPGRWKISNSEIELVVGKEVSIDTIQKAYGNFLKLEMKKEITSLGLNFIYKIDKTSIKEILVKMIGMERSLFANPNLFYDCCMRFEVILREFQISNSGSSLLQNTIPWTNNITQALTNCYGADFALDFFIYYGYCGMHDTLSIGYLTQLDDAFLRSRFSKLEYNPQSPTSDEYRIVPVRRQNPTYPQTQFFNQSLGSSSFLPWQQPQPTFYNINNDNNNNNNGSSPMSFKPY